MSTSSTVDSKLDEAFQWQSVFTSTKDPYFVSDMFKKSIDKTLYDHEMEVWLAQMLIKYPTLSPEYVLFCHKIRLEPFEIQEAKKQCFLNPHDVALKQTLDQIMKKHETFQLELDVSSFANVRKFIVISKSETLGTLAIMYSKQTTIPFEAICGFEFKGYYYSSSKFDTIIDNCNVSDFMRVRVSLDWGKLFAPPVLEQT